MKAMKSGFVFIFALAVLALKVYLVIEWWQVILALLVGPHIILGILTVINDLIEFTTPEKYATISTGECEEAEPEEEKIDIDSMSGPDFERFCADLLRTHGYTSVCITPASGDQGIDITAEKDGMKWGFQCKRWGVQTSVGNNEVMQTYAGKAFYHCDIAAVITTSYFTRKAEEYAQQTGVLLWGRDRLFQMMEKME